MCSFSSAVFWLKAFSVEWRLFLICGITRDTIWFQLPFQFFILAGNRLNGSWVFLIFTVSNTLLGPCLWSDKIPRNSSPEEKHTQSMLGFHAVRNLTSRVYYQKGREPHNVWNFIHLWAKKLICLCFMDATQKHEQTIRSETKNTVPLCWWQSPGALWRWLLYCPQGPQST